MKGYHCTRNIEQVKKEGIVKPSRMKNVFLFRDKEDAEFYKKEFGYFNIVEVSYEPKQILRKWQASYGLVIKLKNKEVVPLLFDSALIK